MKLAADFREIARNVLRGKWPVAILTGFLASVMGACIISNGGGTSGNNNNNSSQHTLSDNLNLAQWRTTLQVILGVLILWIIATLIVSGAGKLGYAIFNLNLVDGKEARVSDLFSQFHRLGEGFVMNLLMALYTLLWSLLFVIPGIIKTYSYAMTPYIMAEHPALTADEAITESRRIMDGNKMRLFCLCFSFIGWGLLCTLPTIALMAIVFGRLRATGDLSLLFWLIPCGIPSFVGSLFLVPYQQAAFAAFYRDVAGTPQTEEAELPQVDEEWMA